MLSNNFGQNWSWLLLIKDNNGGDQIFWQALYVISATFIASFLLLRVIKKPRNDRATLPPGPRGLPLVGYLPFMGKNVIKEFVELAKIYGPIYKLWLGRKVSVVLSSSSMIKEVVHVQDLAFANRSPSIAGLIFTCGGNDIAVASYGPHWRMLRKIFVHEMLSNANMEASRPLRRRELKKSIRDVYGKTGTPIHIGELAFTVAANMVTSMMWGGALEGENGTSLAAELGVAASQLSVLLGRPNVSDFFPFLARFDIQGIERNTKKVTIWIERIFDDVIKRHKEMNATKSIGADEDGGKDFLQFLLERKEVQDEGRSLTMSNIKAMLMDTVVAGTDTTRVMVEWVMAETLYRPEVLNKIHEELSEVVGNNNNVEEFHIPKLIYLHAVLKETLRLHPAAPFLLPHCPKETCTVGGYTIPKGTRVFLNVWALHRDPNIWDSPNEFMPERFLNPAVKVDFLSSNYQYLPFGSGRRRCAGLPLAERVLMIVLASFLHLFEWRCPEGTEPDVTERLGIVLEKLTPLFATPSPRFSDIQLYG